MRLLFLIALSILLLPLFAAEIRDGQLFLEVNINSGKQLEITSGGNFSISEIGSPLSGNYQGKAKLSIVTADEQMMWGLLNSTESVDVNSSELNPVDNIREIFLWQDGKLTIQHQKLTFEDKYFSSQESAEKYALETGYPVSMIHMIIMQNAGLKVMYDNNETDFYQLPVRIECSSPASFGGQSNDYNGVFTVKPIDGKLILSNLQNLESYVVGVVPNEIGDSAPEEALKMQAVATRTHAISLLLSNKHLDDGFDLCDGTHCQVYKGNHLVSEKILFAVQDTKGIVMLYESKIIDAVYSSNCGGITETNQGAWFGKPISYLQGVNCNPETDSLDLTIEANAVKWINQPVDTAGMTSWEKRSENWEKSITKIHLEKNTGVKNIRKIQVLSRGVSGRIINLKLIGSNTVNLKGEYKIRHAFGNLPSSFFYVKNSNKTSGSSYSLPDTIILKGKGFGHGVGLCQVGALQKAREDWTWQEILSYYYPGINFSTEWLDCNANNYIEKDTE